MLAWVLCYAVGVSDQGLVNYTWSLRCKHWLTPGQGMKLVVVSRRAGWQFLASESTRTFDTIPNPFTSRRKPEVLEYLSRSLHECNPEEVAFFLPQLVQMLRTDHDGVVARFLLDAAAVSVHFAVVLACQLRSEGTPPDEAFDPQVST